MTVQTTGVYLEHDVLNNVYFYQGYKFKSFLDSLHLIVNILNSQKLIEKKMYTLKT